MIRWWSDLDADQRWTLGVTLPAWALALPIYGVWVGLYIVGREAFGHGVDFIESCEGVVLGKPVPERDVA